MPELPEMENYKLLLNKYINNRMITNVLVNREKSINVPVLTFTEIVANHFITRIERRAKHLLFYLDNGNILVLHLMLGGWMFFGTEEQKPKRTIQIRLSFGNEHLYFIGLRLGYLHLFQSITEVEGVLAELGPEPLEASFNIEHFKQLLIKRKGRLKSKLIDQQFIAGIGNCYSDEICFKAGLLPMRDISDLSNEEQSELYTSMQYVLHEAIKHGGYMENPFYFGDILTGGYNENCKVYDREGDSCYRCGTNIVKDTISSRKTFYCPQCQR